MSGRPGPWAGGGGGGVRGHVGPRWSGHGGID